VRKGAPLGHRKRSEPFTLGERGLEFGVGDAGRARGHEMENLLERVLFGLGGEAALDELRVEERGEPHSRGSRL
jgi:hypothetical protein